MTGNNPQFGAFGTPGLSTLHGAVSVNYRDHFPAILTSAFSASSGYSWSRLFLESEASSPSIVEATVTNSGSYAFTPDNNTTLAVGTRGYLFAEPNAGGWIFIASNELTPCAQFNPGFDTTDCLKVTVVATSGLCSTIDASQEVFLVWDSVNSWDSGAADWTSTGSGGTGQISFFFTNGYPYLTIDGVYGTPLGCDGGGLLFSFGGATLCAGGTDTTCANYFVVRVECTCCPITDFTTDGWYCVVVSPDTCISGTKYCVELLISDGSACNSNLVICSGPYTEQECLAACTGAGTGVATDCCANPIAETVYLHVVGDSCADTIALLWDGSAWSEGLGTIAACSGVNIKLECVTGSWRLSASRFPLDYVQFASSTTCNPFSLTFPDAGEFDVCCGGSGPIAITVNLSP